MPCSEGTLDFGAHTRSTRIPQKSTGQVGGAPESTTCQRVFWDEEGGHRVAYSVRKDYKMLRMSKRVRYIVFYLIIGIGFN